MGNSLLNIGLTGVRAAQTSMATTEHNISNVNTTGYNRQRTEQRANTPNPTGGGYIGQGTEVSTIRRMYDQFLTTRLNQSQSLASELDAQSGQISQIDNLLADANAGLSPALQDFFTGVNDVAANPSLTSARQSMLASAQVLAQRFDSMNQRISDLQTSVNGEVSNAVEQINIYAKDIANLNAQIKLAQSVNSQPPNDLLDQRDQAITELSKYIGNSVVTDASGTYSVFIGSGQPLVLGDQASTMTSAPSSTDPSKLTVGLRSPQGAVLNLSESSISGGSLGGVLKFRSQSLDGATNTLGQIAASVALTFNAQQAVGQDLLGNSAINNSAIFANSQDLFTITRTFQDDSGVQISLNAASFDPAAGNYYTNLKASDYSLTVDGTGPVTYSVTRLIDSQVIATHQTVPANLTSEGFTIQSPLPATLAAMNDTITIRPTRHAADSIVVNQVVAGDSRLIAASAPLSASAASTNVGSMKISTGDVGPGYAGLAAAVPLSMTYDGTNLVLSTAQTYQATYSDGTVVSPGAASPNVSFLNGTARLTKLTLMNGAQAAFTVDISGTPSVSGPDRFTIAKNTGALSDSRNAVKFSKLQTQNTMNGPGATSSGLSTFQSAYAGLVGQVGAQARQAQVSNEAQQAMLEQNQAARDSESAVNLDEEAANLIKYQQAYQAAAKAISIASTLFDSILAIKS